MEVSRTLHVSATWETHPLGKCIHDCILERTQLNWPHLVLDPQFYGTL